MITSATADQLEALALTIIATPSSAGIDAQYLALIAPVMLAIDGRTMASGFRYSLNVTNALQGRPRHWYMELNEYNTANPAVSSPRRCQCGLLCVPDVATGFSWSANSYGDTLGLATCAAICRAWAVIVRLWLAGNYPLAVAQPTP